MSVSIDEFREGMRRLAASVNIIATRDPAGTRIGMTATAVCSVSGDPPTLLCCINGNNQSHDAITGAGVFSVNVLAAGDEDLANRFASPMAPEERFDKGSWAKHDFGDGSDVPVLDSAAAWFACRVVQQAAIGSHTVFFGQIEALRTRGSHVMPLLYAHGGYGSFGQPTPALQDLMWTPDWQVYD